MDRVSIDRLSGADDFCDIEVALDRGARPEKQRTIGGGDVRGTRIRLGVHRDAFDPELAAGLNDSNRDLATIRNQQPSDHEPLQPGLRFSRNARRPSCPSSDTRRLARAAAVIGTAASNGWFQTVAIRFLA